MNYDLDDRFVMLAEVQDELEQVSSQIFTLAEDTWPGICAKFDELRLREEALREELKANISPQLAM